MDPLDGTKEFVQRRGDFTVNIALVEDGIPTLGVVDAPAKGRRVYISGSGGSVEETGDFAKDTQALFLWLKLLVWVFISLLNSVSELLRFLDLSFRYISYSY